MQNLLYEKCFRGELSRTYKTGEIIIRPDDTPRGVFYIEKGFVKIYSLTPDGSERIHIIYKPGNVFPLIWALRGINKGLFYECIETTDIKMMEKTAFLRRIKGDPELLFDITLLLTDMFEVFVDRVSNLEITNSYPRIISRLLFLSKRFGVHQAAPPFGGEHPSEVLIDVPITHKDIAVSIGMTRETASRELEALAKKGLIRYENHKILIPDLKRLEEELTLHYERKTL